MLKGIKPVAMRFGDGPASAGEWSYHDWDKCPEVKTIYRTEALYSEKQVLALVKREVAAALDAYRLEQLGLVSA